METTGYTPAEIVYGKAVRLNARIFAPAEVREDVDIDTFMEERLSDQEATVAAAAEAQRKYTANHIASNPRVATEFKVGSYVLLAWPKTRMNPNGRPTKLDSMYRGPYQVVSLAGGTYKLRDLTTGKIEPTKSVHSLKEFVYDPKRTNPKDIALKDYKDMFFVESITKHKGQWQRKSKLQFLTKWIGIEEPVWETWTNLRMNEVLHAYLKSKGKTNMIPESATHEEQEAQDEP